MPENPYRSMVYGGEGGIRTHCSSRIRIGVPRFLGVPITMGAISPVSQHLL